MSIRAVILGLLLGLFVSVATYFNNAIIHQTHLIGNHFPIGVFGVVLLLLVGANPLLGLVRDYAGLGWIKGPLRPTELGLIAAIGLAACGWPGSNFYRGFTANVTMPQHWLKTNASWKASNVMAYVPGASATLGEGHVQDWQALVEGLRAGAESDADPLIGSIWASLPERAQRTIRMTDARRLPAADRQTILGAINDYVIAPEDAGEAAMAGSGSLEVPLYVRPGASPPRGLLAERSAVLDDVAALREAAPQDPMVETLEAQAQAIGERANRMVLVELWPGALMPPPEGAGLLVAGGRADAFLVDTLIGGRPENDRLALSELPWSAWWPTIRLWGGAALALGLGSLCLALIVHPQWSRRELLTYPIVKFLDEASERGAGDWLPGVARNRIFWIGLAVPVVIHLINGIHVWFPQFPEIPLTLDFGGMRELFPNARQMWMSNAYFMPTLYLSVIAFAFFLSTSVSFSLGISQLMWVMLGSAMLAGGQTFDSEVGVGVSKGNMIRFGAYLGATAIILYTGRRYYLNVAASMVGLPRDGDTPAYAPWAARGLVLCCVLAVVVLTSGGLGWWMAVLFVAIAVMLFLVMSRISAETGLIFMQAWWMPFGVLTALLGVEAIGPTTYIVLALASTTLVGDPRESLMPFLTNGLKMADHPADGATPGKAMPWLGIMIVVGFFVAGALTLYMQYNFGIDAQDSWARQALPTMPFNELANNIKQMSSDGTLADATAATGLDRLALVRPESDAVPWMLAGVVLVIAVSAARLRLPWWPLHPVAFLVWGTYPMSQFAAAFLVGWGVKTAVIRTGGVKSYHRVKPLMVGAITGELLMALGWIIVGASYYWATGLQPKVYRIFPG